MRPGTFETATGLLRNGALVSVAFDIAGSMPTPFLGRTVSLASGSSKLAFAADAVVLPFVMWRRGKRPVLRFEKPLDSRDFETPQELQVALASVVERWVLQRPEAVWPLQHHQGGSPLVRARPQSPALANETTG